MSKINKHKHRLLCYDFWSWQYTKRNPRILTKCRNLVAACEPLVASGLIADAKHAPGALAIFETGHPRDLFGILRDPTPEEIDQLMLIDRLDLEEPGCGIDPFAICDDGLDSVSIIDALHNGSDIYYYTPDIARDSRGEGSAVHHYGAYDMEQFNNAIGDNWRKDKTNKHIMAIDTSKSTKKIVGDFLYLLGIIKCEESGGDPSSCVSCKSKDCEPMYEAFLEGDVTEIMARPGVAFSPDKPEPRAIGLWLWDYVQEYGGKMNRGTIAKAIRAMRELLVSLGGDFAYYASPDESGARVLRSLYEKTEKCIEACEVLKF